MTDRGMIEGTEKREGMTDRGMIEETEKREGMTDRGMIEGTEKRDDRQRDYNENGEEGGGMRERG